MSARGKKEKKIQKVEEKALDSQIRLWQWLPHLTV